ncbi:MAG TPA: DNA replication/repair protein RecF [Dokdonella sp.]
MHLSELRIADFRNIEQVELELSPRWNFFVGANGSGKTSLLEAAYVLSHGRSFRATAKEALIRWGRAEYTVFGELVRSAGRVGVGISRGGGGLEARVGGASVPIAELMRGVAVLCFEPGSHELISGTSEERRRFLDWGVFHVEHDFLALWRRYQRALRQRNLLLRLSPTAADLDAWDRELVAAGEPMTVMRRRYFDALRPLLDDVLRRLLTELGEPRVVFHGGFGADLAFADVLQQQRGRDGARGFTGDGPHRADWTLLFERAPRRDHLSRGQEKLCAFACVAAQAMLHAASTGEWPVLCLDDLASELDPAHQRKVLALVAEIPVQVLATGTSEPEEWGRLTASPATFHVEQGRASRLL